MSAAGAEPRRVRQLIGGEWLGEPEAVREDPARPGTAVSLSAVGDASDVDAAVEAARAAYAGWRDTPAPQRGAVLARAAELLSGRSDEVALDLCAEEGKTIAEARGEVLRAADILRFQAGTGWRSGGQTFPSATPGTLVYSAREPLGVVGLITPWNFPIAIPAWKLAPALVAGNTVVLKPAGPTAVSAQHLVRCLVEAGLPAGVLNLVLGRGSVVGERLAGHPAVAAVSFTGSTEVGGAVLRATSERGARVQLEMGGKNATVVLADADPARAAAIIAAGAFGLTGQACTATSRVVVERPAHDAVVSALLAEAPAWAPGDGRSEGIRMGPVVTPEQLECDLEYVRVARDEGGELLHGGTANEQFLAPTIVGGVSPAMRIAREEVFGPVLAVIAVEDLDEAVSVTNSTSYGLTAGIVTRDLHAAMRFAREAEAGIVKVNRPTTGVDLNAPFGGVKDSSTGTHREQGPGAIEFYSRERTVYLGD